MDRKRGMSARSTPRPEQICCDAEDHGEASTAAVAAAAERGAVSPCPFEAYCCVDETCDADGCVHVHIPCAQPCTDADCTNNCADKCSSVACDSPCAEVCAEACFDPHCSEEPECCAPAEICDDPECEPENEWCPDGCTVEEYIQQCTDACQLLVGAAPPPVPMLDFNAALAGKVVPPAAPVVFPGGNVCHWSNCHRQFDTAPELLSHIAADHLGGLGGAAPAQMTPQVPTPQTAQTTPHAQITTPAAPASTPSGLGLDGLSFNFDSSLMSQPSVPLPTPGQPSGDLFSCLWDDCFPDMGAMVGPQLPVAPPCTDMTHDHPHPHPHSHSHSRTHNDAGEPLSPQTMLRHLLEEHLGVSAAALWAATEPVQQDVNMDHGHAHHAHAHPHAHPHPHPHAHHVRQSSDFKAPKLEPMERKPYTRPESHTRTHLPHSHAHSHTHGHVHPHAHHGHTHHAHGHHHHGDFPPTPSSTPSDETLHICRWPDCPVTAPFPTAGALMEHLSEDHVGRGKDSYRCHWDGCGGPEGRLFSSRQKVLRHLQSHTGHRPFVCTVCGQAYSEAAPLAAHMRRHADDKPFACTHPGCGKAFAIASSLTIHMRTHNGNKPFICPHCNKGFVEASNLTKHIRTHTGEKPFACTHPGCVKRFSRPDQLKRHMSVHDGAKARERERAAASAGFAMVPV